MNFIVSSSELLRALSSGLKVITKTTSPILENFLFNLKDNRLEITASDSETILKTTIDIENVGEEGAVAVPAKILTDLLKEFPDVPLEFTTLEDGTTIELKWANGVQSIPFFDPEYYPADPKMGQEFSTAVINSEDLLNGIGYTLYATADEVLRPVMNGILFDLAPEGTSLVASDSHKLVCYTHSGINAKEKSSFILPKKPASILKGLLSRSDEPVNIRFDGKNAHFSFQNIILIGRLVEGTYPAYRSVIPKNNPNKLILHRQDLLNAAKRVSICSNPATSSLKFTISYNELNISAQDLNSSISANENVPCQYDGDPLEIGFKSPFLIDILTNLPYDDICFELANNALATLIVNAAPSPDDKEDICTLLMPVRITY
ncbi:MAG: DNA polymerase III subunit beta [Bacteroidales bacterium]|nr:DNA polymerase III subunit beta [Bacteroidales bacterium]